MVFNSEGASDTNGPDSHFAKKSLGQNFLKSERALSNMVEAGDIREGETIIEIGPGKGALTTKLLEKIKNTPESRLICIEKDDRLIPFLQETYKQEIENGVLSLIHGDIIDILKDKKGFEALVPLSKVPISTVPASNSHSVDRSVDHSAGHSTGHSAGHSSNYKVIANIPYYITGLIFRGIFSLDHLPEKIVLLVQKEVANRIMAYGDNGQTSSSDTDTAGKESILSISIKLYGKPRRVSVVPRGAFVPAPAVDSAIISVEGIARKIPKERDALFFDMIHAAFSHKRKRLAKNLESFSARTSAQYEMLFEELGLDKNVRAEDISIQTYIQLFERLI
jgi:16S rRNA (adenine1518-N6/adenine1519-N6)-dimethyltransferase